MKTKLFISLSVVALFGLSATAYGTLYINGKDKDGNFPKGDCWEMKCPNGCVEEEGTFTGHCCPGGDSCRINGKDIAECCGEGKTCNEEGKCVNNCPEPTKTSCSIGADILDSKGCVTTKKINCEDTEGTPICSKTGKCIECEKNTDCSGLRYCNNSTNICNACPVRLPKAGEKCTDTCGCSNGLTCVAQGNAVCGFTGVCKSVCESNSDCKRGEYCAFENYTGQCEKGLGECRSNVISGKTYSSKDYGTFYTSAEIMTWWSAKNWCASHGWDLTGVYDSLGCYYGSSYVSNLGGNSATHCCKPGQEDCWNMKNDSHKGKVSDGMKKLRNALGKEGCYWTDHHSSCNAYTIGLPSNQIWNTPMTGRYSLSSGNKNHMHALCQ